MIHRATCGVGKVRNCWGVSLALCVLASVGNGCTTSPKADAPLGSADSGASDRAGSAYDGGSDGAGDGGHLATLGGFTLVADESGTLPFTIGLGFGRGDVPLAFTVDLPNAQVDVKRRWNDGSVKHAIVSGHAVMTAGQPLKVHVTDGQHDGGTALTCADLEAKAPSASASFGSYGQVTLANLFGAPVRTWLSGTEAVECHYTAPVGADPTLRVEFHVRAYRGGRTFVRVIAENGYLDRSAADKSYTPAMTIAGATVLAGPALVHYAHTRWLAEGWIGGEPKITPTHDTGYLMQTRLVPNYWTAKAASSAALDALTQVYTPMAKGDWTASMGETGYQPQIGLLPNQEALYFTSGADARAYRSVIANANALGSYAIVWRDGKTDLPVRPSQRPNWTIEGDNGGGANGVTAGELTWELAHHPSGGYLAYLLTGDYVHLQTMQHQASLVYLVNSSSLGSGVARILSGQTRALAWSNRTVGQLAAIAPAGTDDPVTEDYRVLLGKNAEYWSAVATSLGGSALGLFYEYNLNLYAPATIAPWQQSFVAQTFGHVSDLEPLADMTAWNRTRDFVYHVPVGLLGDGGSNAYCFARASVYNITIGSGQLSNLSQAFTNWHDVDVATNGNGNDNGSGACSNTLQGGSGGAPDAAAIGYWGNLLPAIAYAHDHGATGAGAAWSRLTSASNWSVVEGSDWANSAVWGVVPRQP